MDKTDTVRDRETLGIVKKNQKQIKMKVNTAEKEQREYLQFAIRAYDQDHNGKKDTRLQSKINGL